MNGAIIHHWPDRAAILQRLGEKLMEIILHVGTHYTATISFQHYLRHHALPISAMGTGIWGPLLTRNSLFSGLFRCPGATMRRTNVDRVRGRIAQQLEKARETGIERLLLSDET